MSGERETPNPLREAREQAELSREQAASAIGVSSRTLGRWEAGGGIRWRGYRLRIMASVYGVTVDELEGREATAA